MNGQVIEKTHEESDVHEVIDNKEFFDSPREVGFLEALFNKILCKLFGHISKGGDEFVEGNDLTDKGFYYVKCDCVRCGKLLWTVEESEDGNVVERNYQ